MEVVARAVAERSSAVEARAVEGEAVVRDQDVQRLDLAGEAHVERDAVGATRDAIGVAELVLAGSDRTDHVEAAVARRHETHRLDLGRDALERRAGRQGDVHERRLRRPGDRRAGGDLEREVDVRVESRVVQVDPYVRARES